RAHHRHNNQDHAKSPPQIPSGRSHGRQPSPSRDRRRNASHPYHQRGQSFQAGAGKYGHSACALCLGRSPHNIHKCESTTTWDGGKPYCYRNSNGKLVGPGGNPICYDWQRPNGCESTSSSCQIRFLRCFPGNSGLGVRVGT
ncbi:hypothetical protein BV22DRAFT_1026401, partial [Leucogyrophana mollusca]